MATVLETKLNEILNEKTQKILPENIKKGTTIFGINGEYEGLDTSDATATASEIFKDKTAYVNGQKIVGTYEETGGSSEYNATIKNPNSLTTFKLTTWTTEINSIDLTGATSASSGFNGLSNLKKIGKILNTSGVTNMASMFYGCSSLESISEIDMSNVTDATQMFYNCKKLNNISLLNASKNTSIKYIFYQCSSLVELNNLDTQSVTDFSYAFNKCTNLNKLPQFDCEQATRMNNVLTDCTVLKDFGGFLNLGKAYTQASANYSAYRIDVSTCTMLTHESLLNIFNNLYDLNLTYNVAGGGTLYSQKIILGSSNVAKLTSDEIAIATNKGWTVSI